MKTEVCHNQHFRQLGSVSVRIGTKGNADFSFERSSSNNRRRREPDERVAPTSFAEKRVATASKISDYSSFGTQGS